ncbi:MAG: copper-binding protein [Alphaproteobacteria bacterium]|nr:copper-binding protein [Alphaproteobacteria bacterium]
MGDGIGHATGVIKSLGSKGDFVTLQHGPFEGIDMGAMTMGFDIMGDVDLSGFTEGDTVAFMVKQGRDGSFRVMSMCNTAIEGADCLDSMMDH